METGDLEGQILLLVFKEATPWSFDASTQGPIHAERHRYAHANATLNPIIGPQVGVPLYDEDLEADWTRLHLQPEVGRLSSLILVAQSIRFDSNQTAAHIDVLNQAPANEWQAGVWDQAIRTDRVLASRPIAYAELERAEPTTFKISGLQSIEWTGAQPICNPEASCPREENPAPYILDYIEQTLQNGTATLTAHPDLLVLAGTLHVQFHGTARLPAARGELACTNCTLEDDVLTLHGDIHLRSLQAALNGSSPLHADLDGDFLARINEGPPQSVSPPPIAAVALAATAGLAILFRIFFALVSQRILDAPLSHPARQSIHETLDANPGITYRQLMQFTGIGNGSLQHHLRILERARSIRHWRNDRNLHFALFDVRPVAAMQKRTLEDDAMNALCAYLAHPDGRMQLDIVTWAKQTHGWARSTTQSKLTRLCTLGLARVHKEGFRRIYEATDVASETRGVGA